MTCNSGTDDSFDSIYFHFIPPCCVPSSTTTTTKSLPPRIKNIFGFELIGTSIYYYYTSPTTTNYHHHSLLWPCRSVRFYTTVHDPNEPLPIILSGTTTNPKPCPALMTIMMMMVMFAVCGSNLAWCGD